MDSHVRWEFPPTMAESWFLVISVLQKQAYVWPLTPKTNRRHVLFLNLTCDFGPIDMRQSFQRYSDMGQGYFLNLTCDMGINK